jgi:molybdate transport system ATP-binding protein
MKNPFLYARVRLALAEFSLETDLELHGGVTAILGPSGSGKTSFLEVLAGLRQPLEACVATRERVLEDTSSSLCLPPEDRWIGYLPQDVLLFPHLTVEENILYGAKRAEGRTAPTWDAVLEILDIKKLLGAFPDRLSGGERQRVGLARALLSGPEILLLDEPLSALDGDLKGRILPYLKRIRDRFQIPVVYVTHDLSDIMTLADEVVIFEKGHVAIQGDPLEALTRALLRPQWEGKPLENVLDGTIEFQEQERGLTRVRVGQTGLWVPFLSGEPGARLQLSFSAEDVLVSTEAIRGISARNILHGRVEYVISDGTDLVKAWVGFPLLARLTRDAAEDLGLREESQAYFILKSGSIRCLAEEPATSASRREKAS